MPTIANMILPRISLAALAPPALLIPGLILALPLSLTARLVLAEAQARQLRGLDVSAPNSHYARRLGYPKHRIQSALSELERAGYLVRHYTRPPVARRLLAFTFPPIL